MLSRDLQKAFPGLTGFSAANLWRMRQFYAEHAAEIFLAQVAREMKSGLPEGHSDKSILAQAVRELGATIPWAPCRVAHLPVAASGTIVLSIMETTILNSKDTIR
jgi:DUF1016 N-terminal domain